MWREWYVQLNNFLTFGAVLIDEDIAFSGLTCYLGTSYLRRIYPIRFA
jgi:hypothetical protein